jgi:hypothetical protein
MLMSNLCGLMMLLLACWLVPRTWQERGAGAPVLGSRGYAWKYGGRGRRARLRRLLDLNPILWLNCRERWQRLGIWTLTVAMLSTFVGMALIVSREILSVWWFCSYLYVLLLYLWMASQAGRFFVDARRNGVMELLLISPLGGREIVLGLARVVETLWRASGAAGGHASAERGLFPRINLESSRPPRAGHGRNYPERGNRHCFRHQYRRQPSGVKLVWDVVGHDLKERSPRQP